MIDVDDEPLRAQLRTDEGVRRHYYRDSVGILTVGVGHNCQAVPLPHGWECPLSDEQIDWLLSQDLENVFADLDRNAPWWREMSDNRQRVLANMCFNMGWPVLATFVNTLAAMRAGKYPEAVRGMLASLWARQVGARAERLADVMKKG